MPFLETSITMDTSVPEELVARFEELNALEFEFEDVELEISMFSIYFYAICSLS